MARLRETIWKTGRRVASASAEVVRAGYEFVYPSACPLCGAEETGSTQPTGRLAPPLCEACRRELLSPSEDFCVRCAAPVGPHLETSKGCVHCRGTPFRFERAYSIGVYDGLMRTACLRAKSPGGAGLAAALGELLFVRHGEALAAQGFDCVVPVPQHWTRRLGTRSHHAAETLSKVLARRLNADHQPPILRKIRRTADQGALPATRRRTNLRGAFRTRAAVGLSGATVLLVDDILTTGSTANETARALLRGGVSRVVVAVVARSLAQ